MDDTCFMVAGHTHIHMYLELDVYVRWRVMCSHFAWTLTFTSSSYIVLVLCLFVCLPSCEYKEWTKHVVVVKSCWLKGHRGPHVHHVHVRCAAPRSTI